MGASRKRRRLVAGQKQRIRDEELGRFGRLVGGVIVAEILVLFLVLAQNGWIVRPLG